jgi:GDP-mannose 6-dehydrogenase
VKVALLAGANREFILSRIPHISNIMVDDVDAVLAHSQTIVIGNRNPDSQTAPRRLRVDEVLADFVQISEKRSENGKYDGISW